MVQRVIKNKTEVLKSESGESALFIPTVQQQKYHKIILGCLLTVFGIYLSILYFGHTEVPNSDFPYFYKTGQEILSFKAPSSFKRGPVVGILQVIINLFVGEHSPSLIAGWLLNAILYPLNCLLLYLIAEKIVAKAGVWIALLSAINPTAVYLLTEPIAETTLLFFVLLTIYLILKRSKWCWFFASITAITRYEGAALIIAALVMDMIYAKDKKERLASFKYTVIACVPLGLWMFGTFATGLSDRSHYLRIYFGKDFAKWFAEMGGDLTGVVLHWRLLWQVAVLPLITPAPGMSYKVYNVIAMLSLLIPLVAFCYGAVLGLCRKRWDILVLLIFFVPYFLIHAAYPYPIPRYHGTIFWIMLLVSWYGFQNAWQLLARYAHLHKYITLGLIIILAVFSFVRMIKLIPVLKRIQPQVGTELIYTAYAAILAAIIVVGLWCVLKRGKGLLTAIAVLVIFSSFAVSGQFELIRLLGSGQRDKEFKILAHWYRENYQPGDKIAVYMAAVVKLFAPELSDSIVNLPRAETPEEFIDKCRDEGITYVVWATREMSKPHTEGYKMAGLHNITFLDRKQNIGPYQFVHQINFGGQIINIFRLRYADPEGDEQ